MVTRIARVISERRHVESGLGSALGAPRGQRIKELARADDSDPAKTPKGLEESIACHDHLGLGLQRTLEDAIVGVVVGDRGDGLGGDDQDRKLTDCADRFLRPSGSPLELPDEHAFKLLQDREGDEELELAGPRSGKHFASYAAYVELGDVHVRVSDDAEHEQGRAGTLRPRARCRSR